MTQVVRGTKKS